MKKLKIFLPILLFVMLFPLVANAETKYLYDVLKNEAKSGGLQKNIQGNIMIHLH